MTNLLISSHNDHSHHHLSDVLQKKAKSYSGLHTCKLLRDVWALLKLPGVESSHKKITETSSPPRTACLLSVRLYAFTSSQSPVAVAAIEKTARPLYMCQS